MSTTTVPPAPSTPTYGLSTLNEPGYPSFSDASTAIAAGIINDADPTRPQKPWYDPATLAAVNANPALGTISVTYDGYQAPNASSLPTEVSTTLTFVQAAHINMPTAAQMTAAQTSPNANALLAEPFYSGIDPVPNPARALLPTETIIWNPMPGGPVLVGNTANGYAPAGTPGSPGSDSATIAAIYTMVCGIATELKVPVVPVS